MNWEAIGAVGETIGAIAVLFTVLYLAVQIGHSNKLLQAQHREMNRTAMLDINRLKIESREFSELMAISRTAPDELDDIDTRRVRAQLQDEILAYQSLFLRGELMGEERMNTMPVQVVSTIIAEHAIGRELFNGPFDAKFKEAVNKWSDT